MRAFKVPASFWSILWACLSVASLPSSVHAQRLELAPIELCPTPAGWALEFPIPALNVSATVDCIRLTFVDVESAVGPGGKKGPRAVEVRGVFEADVAAVHSAIPGLIGSQMPGSSCKERWQHKGTNIQLSNGNLTFVGFLGYENWWCWEHNWICCENWSCRGCSRTESGRIFEISPSVHGTVRVAAQTPYESCAANPATADQTIATDVNVRQEANLSDDQKFLLKVLGAIGGGVSGGLLGVFGGLGGSAAGWVLVDKQLEQLQRPDLRQNYLFPVVRMAQETEHKLYFCTQDATFVPRPNGTALAVRRVARTSRTKAEQLWKTLKAQQAYAADKATPATTTVVEKGEGLWNVSERLYGDGRYFVLLRNANPGLRARPLVPGESINLPRFSKVVDDGGLIREGDTLWAIAERTLGDGKRYRELIRGKERQFSDPDKILPLWTLTPQ